jgi:hypothetical protein
MLRREKTESYKMLNYNHKKAEEAVDKRKRN